MITVPPVDFFRNLKPFHKKFLYDFEMREYKGIRYFALVWHRRSGKSTTVLNLLIREAMQNPNHVYLYVAPTYTQAKSIIWTAPNMLLRWLPNEIVDKKNEAELYIKLTNGSMIILKGADNPDSLRGIEADGIVFDEYAIADKPEAWNEVLGPIIRPYDNKWAIFIFTPKGQNHALDLWRKAEMDKQWYRSLVTAEESGVFDSKALKKIKDTEHPTIYDQEYMCSFLADEEFTFITSQMLEQLKNKNQTWGYEKRFVSIDPAFGGDICKLYAWSNLTIKDELSLHTRDEDAIIGQCAMFARKNNSKNIIIDSCGHGRVVAKGLENIGFNVKRIESAESSINKNCSNRRSELWYKGSQKVYKGIVSYPEDVELRKQITSVRFRPDGRNGLIAAVSKDYTRKLLGYSPDLADAWIYGLEGFDIFDPDDTGGETAFFGTKRYFSNKDSYINDDICVIA